MNHITKYKTIDDFYNSYYSENYKYVTSTDSFKFPNVSYIEQDKSLIYNKVNNIPWEYDYQLMSELNWTGRDVHEFELQCKTAPSSRMLNPTYSGSRYTTVDQIKNASSSQLAYSYNLKLGDYDKDLSLLYRWKGELLGVPKYDTSKVTNMSYMFMSCSKLDYCPEFDTRNVTDMEGMFFRSGINKCPNFNTSNVTNMHEMFCQCSDLTYVPDLNTSKVTDMSFMFSESDSPDHSSRVSVPIVHGPNFDTGNVTNMSHMYYDCPELLDVPKYNTSKVTNMLFAFAGCTSLTSIPEFDTGLVTNMKGMLFNTAITTVPAYNTSNVTTMYAFVSWCDKLVDFPSLDTHNVTDMYRMFDRCSSLKTIGNLNVSKATDLRYFLRDCSSLDSFELSGGVLSNCDVTGMFDGIKSTGTFYYHTPGNYDPILNILPAGWTATPIEDPVPPTPTV